MPHDYRFITDPDDLEIEQIARMYRAAGWWDDEDDQNPNLIRRIVAGSHCFLTVRDGDAIVGMGRAISDGVNDAYIQDVTTRTDLRHRGVGSALVDRLVERLQKDGIRWIGLIAADNTQPFYEKLGFARMPLSSPMLMMKRIPV